MATLEVITQLNATVDEVLQDNDSGDISASDLKGLFRNFLSFSVDSAYAIWLEAGNAGNKADFLAFIKGKSTYELAVIAGYMGTQTEWLTAQESSRVDAANSAQTATTKAQTATTKASEAVTSAQTAATKASEAVTSANSAANSAQTATTKASEAVTTAANIAISNAAALSAANNAVTLGQTANLQGVRLGVWNPVTNTQSLTADASAIVAGGFYDVVVAGTSSVTGTSTAFVVGDRIAKVANVWVRLPFSLVNYYSKDDLGAVEKIAKLIVGKNKFNPALIVVDKFVSYNASPAQWTFGSISTGTGWASSGYQEVKASTQYTLSGVINVGQKKGMFFDASKNPIGTLCFDANTTFTTPTGCAYIYFSIKESSQTTAVYSAIQLEEGATATSYEAYNVMLSDAVINPTIARKTDIPSVSNYVSVGVEKNKFNTTIIVVDKFVGFTNNSGVISYGGIFSGTGWASSGYQEVKASTQYTLSGVTTSPANQKKLSFFDSAKNVIGTSCLNINTTFTTPTGCVYVYFTVRESGDAAAYSAIQLEEGANSTSFEAYTLVIADNVIPTTIARKTDIPSTATFVATNIGKNKFNPALIVVDKFISYNVSPVQWTFASIASGTGWASSGYQKVKASTQYTLSGVINVGQKKGMFFDASKNPIGTIAFLTNSTFTTPVGCAYVYFSIKEPSQTTAVYSIIQLEEGATATNYEAYNVVGGYSINQKSSWSGKKILWMGTSIPQGNPSVTKPYPIGVADLLGATVTNVALSGSLLRISKADGTQSTNGDYHYKNFARTKAEYQSLLSQFGQAGTYSTFPSYTQTQIDAFKLNSYEEKLMTRLDQDLYIFDFSWNDYMCDATNMSTVPTDITTRDRKLPWGAFNYVIDQLLTAKPTARFIIVGYWADYQLGATNLIHKALAEYWCVPYVDVAKKNGWANITISGASLPVYRTFVPDNIHPHTDTSGLAETILARICAGVILGL